MRRALHRALGFGVAARMEGILPDSAGFVIGDIGTTEIS
jgi:hypothetical protein